jgi:hypothetical protein
VKSPIDRAPKTTIQLGDADRQKLVEMSEASRNEGAGHYRTVNMIAAELVHLALKHLRALNDAEFNRTFGGKNDGEGG